MNHLDGAVFADDHGGGVGLDAKALLHTDIFGNHGEGYSHKVAQRKNICFAVEVAQGQQLHFLAIELVGFIKIGEFCLAGAAIDEPEV